MATLGENHYGKSRVRIMKVVRHETHHSMKEWNVRVLLHGDFETCFTTGDNSKILPTDTMKNTVYYLARESSAATLEDFCNRELGQFLLADNPQASKTSVEIEEKSWKPMIVDGNPHRQLHINSADLKLQTAEIAMERGEAVKVTSCIDGLVILKTTKSAFTGYIKNAQTTLPESTDRLFGTRATVAWEYLEAPTDYAAVRTTTLETLLKVFAEHDSLSVQHTAGSTTSV